MIAQSFTNAQYTHGPRTIGLNLLEKFSLPTVQTGNYLLCQFFQ